MPNKVNTKTAEIVVNQKENIVEITQSPIDKITGMKKEVTTRVNVETFYFLLISNFNNMKKHSIYCSTAKTELTYGVNKHLRSSGHLINLYLTQGYDIQLINLILKYFPNIENKSEELFPTIEVDNFEQSDNDPNCNSYYMKDFIENPDMEAFEYFDVEEENNDLNLEEIRIQIEDKTLEIEALQSDIINLKNSI